MRKKILSTAYPGNINTKIKILEEAKKLIEANGIEDYVLELSQPCVLGGATYIVTSKKELDKNYVGYRGFMIYDRVCKRLEDSKSCEEIRPPYRDPDFIKICEEVKK